MTELFLDMSQNMNCGSLQGLEYLAGCTCALTWPDHSFSLLIPVYSAAGGKICAIEKTSLCFLEKKKKSPSEG